MKGLASLKSASICGDVEAPRRLALLYTSDNAPPFRGVPKDYTKGYAWSIIVTAKNYDYENAALRENIEKQLLPEQIRLGQQIARECLETNYQRCIL